MNDSPTPPTTRPHHNFSKLAIGNLIVLVLIVAGVIGLVIWHNHKGTKKLTGAYSNLSNFKVPATAKTGSMTYAKPAQFTAPQGIKFSDGQQAFNQIQTLKDGTRIQVGGEASEVLPFTSPVPQGYINKWQTDVANSTHMDSYKGYFDGLDTFLKLKIGSFDLTYTKPQTFTNTNIKSGAARVDFSATPQAEFAKEGFVPLKGAGIIAITPKAIYNFVVYSTDSGWQNNPDDWNAIINSLKIEQQ